MSEGCDTRRRREDACARERMHCFRPPRELGRKNGRACVARTNAAATGVIVAKVGDPPGNI